MSAITGLYRPAKKVYGQWAVDWLHCGLDRWTSPRHHLATQLVAIFLEDFGRLDLQPVRYGAKIPS